MIYLLNSLQIQKVKMLNSESNYKVMIVDHGLGPCIEDGFQGLPGYEEFLEWFESEEFEEAEMPDSSLDI